MSVYHDEIEIEDMEYDEETETYYYPCPCGDRFEITKEDLASGEEVAKCPSCSLMIKVIYDIDDFMEGEEVEASVKMDENQQEVLMDLDLCEVVTNKRYSMTEMSASGEDSGKKSTDSGTTSQSVKDSLKQRLSQNASIATSSNKTEMLPVESQGASNDPWLNPSLLEEVLAEKKLALMRSPEVVHFLQSQQAKIAMETKTSLLQDSNKINKS